MSMYDYKGFNEKGLAKRGTLEAESVKTARAKLRQLGIYPTEINERTLESKKMDQPIGAVLFGKINVKDIAAMTRQLATLVKAHVPVVESLTAVSEQVENSKLRLILSHMRERVNEGASLGDALANYPNIFSPIYINMTRAGEASGTLDLVLIRLADFTDSQVQLKNKIVSALTYPILMMIIAFIIVMGLFTFVVPRITAIFSDFDIALPLITVVMIKTSDLIRGYWYLLLLTVVSVIYLVRRWLKTPRGRNFWDRLQLRLPVFGKIIRMIAVSRFTRTLSTLLNGGVPLLTAMDIVRNVVNNTVIQEALDKARNSISEGQSLSGPLKASGQFPPIVTHMITVGEKTGELESMLNTVSDAYDNEVSTTISGLTSLLEPLLIVAMGVVVGFIVMGILLPILEINKIAG